MKKQYRRIGPVRRVIAAILALIILPAVPLGVVLMVDGEWFGGIWTFLFGAVMGGAKAFAAVTGRSPEHLKDAVYLGGLWGGGS
jgi:hypothetical protein